MSDSRPAGPAREPSPPETSPAGAPPAGGPETDDPVERLLRDGIADLADYVPGRSAEAVKAEFGLDAVDKMASNENPLGPSPLAVEAAREALAESHVYPDGGAGDLRAALAERFGLRPENFFVGNGADDVLQNLARAFVNRGDECVIPAPSFHPYTTVTRVMGGVPVYSPLRQYRIDLADVRARVTERTKLVFLCNPNNPTGTALARTEFEAFLRALPRPLIVVLDEAYLDFVEDHGVPRSESYIRNRETWVVGVRTFSKVYGLAGLRVGYGLGRPSLIRALHRTKDPFNVSRPALAAARAALRDEAFRRRSVRMVHEGKRRIYKGLERLGVEYVPTEANFVLARLGRGAPRLVRALMARGIIVRSCVPFGLEEHIRVTVGPAEQNERFLAALAAVLA